MRQPKIFIRFFTCVSLIATAASAQQNVGIGTLTPDASSSLEIRDTARGLLIPRLTLQQRNSIANPARGLLVFVSTDSSFHYYNGTAWQSLQFADTTGWKRTGNAGTNEASHFIGTTDAVPLNFRINNQKAGRIGLTVIDGTTYFGYQAGNSNTTGSGNVFIGYQTGYANSTGSLNTSIGANSLFSNTTGFSNTAVGYAALNKNTIGAGNVAIGQEALALNTTGPSNTAIGFQALYKNTVKQENTAVGYQALFENTLGYHNTAIGYQSLYSNTDGDKNTAHGYQSLYSNQTGFYNSAVGFFSLYNNQNGARNTALGYSSMFNNTSGNQNTAIGHLSLTSNVSGNQNTTLGFQADVASGNLTNATAIGALARVATSNSMVLGSINGVNGATASTRVGIGTTQPVAPLHVAGTSGNTSATAMRYFNFSSVGITAEPAWAGSTTIYAEGNVCATQAFISAQSFNFSDARIKQIIGPSNNQQDLERLKKIEVTRYRYIDTVSNGSAVQTKVIAQQLKTVMPEAVSYRSQFIPSIMQLASSSKYEAASGELTLAVNKLPELPTNAVVKCYAENGTELLYTLVAANGQTLVLKGPAANGRPFVYGHEVKDFHVVDYDAIGMLNVSATQALLQRIETLEATVRKLQQQ